MKQAGKKTMAMAVTIIMLIATALLFNQITAQAGNLEPSAEPTTGTMHTMEEIYNNVTANKAEIDALKDMLIAWRTADRGNRFIDLRDGTVKDVLTGLIWLQNADCIGLQDWDTAMSSVAHLDSGECALDDGSSEGDWRLPTKEEFQGIGTDPPTKWETGTPRVTYENPYAHFSWESFANLHWTSSSYFGNPTYFKWAILVNTTGETTANQKSGSANVWPVRSDN
jgi:hypothetical protein